MSVTAPPRPPGPRDPVDRQELEALVEALIEEARQRARRRRRIYSAVAAIVALVAVAVFTLFERSAQSQTVSPTISAGSSVAGGTPRSKIAFTSRPLAGSSVGQFASNGLYVVNADGSGKRRLTPIALFSTPAWAPDGRKLAFARQQGGTFVVNADGSGERRLGGGGKPVWSPDGRRIAFIGGTNSRGFYWGLHVMNENGSGQRTVTRIASLRTPAWSPDSRTLAFESQRDGNREIYVVNADGSGLRNLTRNTASDGAPAWSPNGRKIAFVRNFALYVMDADGSKQQRLTRTRARDFTPSWSPDGTRIAFERRQGRWDRVNPRCKLCGGRATIFEVHVMNADGSRQRLLTREQSKLGVARSDAQPKWSPDGRRIAFVSKRDGNDEVYVVNADGSGLRNSTRNSRGMKARLPGRPASRSASSPSTAPRLDTSAAG